MKKLLFLTILFPILTLAQSQNQNYIKSKTYKVASTIPIDDTNPNQTGVKVTYYDGLGRPIQNIASKNSTTGKDIATAIEYDGFGRQVKEYLPFYSSQNNLAFIDNATLISNTVTQYQNNYGDSNPFSEKVFEASPLNRVTKQAAPGNDWANGLGHEIKLDYQTNAANDVVKLFSFTATWDSGKGLYDIPAALTAAPYPLGQLYKSITYDENSAANPVETNGATIEFKDKEGKVILKRTYENGNRLDTYYLYDQFGNLTFVIPPKADSTITQPVLNDLCYQYKYDHKNRVVEKKLPGKQWEFIIYDKLDRPVMTGPALSPFKEDINIGWMYTKYDVFNRPVYGGWYSGHQATAVTRFTLQGLVNAQATISESRTTPTAISNIVIAYTNTVIPTGNNYLLNINYYDNYTFPNAAVQPAMVEGQAIMANVKSLPTGSWNRALTTASEFNGERSTLFYDSKYRNVGTFVANYLGGFTQTNTKLDFSGKTLYTIQNCYYALESETQTRHRKGQPFDQCVKC